MARASRRAFGSAGRGGPARSGALALLSGMLLMLAACAGGSPGSLEYDTVSRSKISESSKAAGVTTGAGVNSFLWRASLDTLSFLPLASADPYGGVIISEWYSTAAQGAERFKVTVYILDQQLRSDALKVSVFRQVKSAGGAWADTPADPAVGTKLENAILTRAREMRIAAVNK